MNAAAVRPPYILACWVPAEIGSDALPAVSGESGQVLHCNSETCRPEAVAR